MADAPRPQCGGVGFDAGSYDLPLHVAALFIVLAASIFGCGFPVVAKKVKWLKMPAKAFFFCKHFGTGVLVSTAFVHLVPTAFSSLTDPCLPPFFTEQYPAFPGVVIMVSLFSLFWIEMYLHKKTGGHSHGGPTGDGIVDDCSVPPHAMNQPPSALTPQSFYDEILLEKAAKADGDRLPIRDTEMPPWFIAFYEQYIREREATRVMLSARAPGLPPRKETSTVTSVDEDLEHAKVDPAVYRKMNLNINLLEGGILFHSVFVGITVSIETEGFIILLIAMVFHQTFEGLGLGSRIASIPYPRGSIRPWVLVVAFGLTAPIGQAIGLVARSSYDPSSALALIMVGTFNAISSGLLIYAALVDLLAADFLSEEGDKMTTRQKTFAFIFVLLGAAGMAVVGAFA